MPSAQICIDSDEYHRHGKYIIAGQDELVEPKDGRKEDQEYSDAGDTKTVCDTECVQHRYQVGKGTEEGEGETEAVEVPRYQSGDGEDHEGEGRVFERRLAVRHPMLDQYLGDVDPVMVDITPYVIRIYYQDHEEHRQ